jgi:pimeloyl-ACP methyl ester carboxylesterase
VTDVLLLHAGIADRRMWAPQLPVLQAAGHEVDAPDLPGYGDAALEAGELSYVDFAADRLGGAAAVVGCSFGGRVALELAFHRPELVDRLVLVGAGLGAWNWSDEAKRGFGEEEALLEGGDAVGAAAQQAGMWLAPSATSEVRELTAAMTLRSYEQQLPFEDQVQATWPQPSAADRLEEIDAPTLVVVGTEDLADIRAIAEHLAARIPGARLARVEGAGHLPSLERPDELNRLLLDFLAA